MNTVKRNDMTLRYCAVHHIYEYIAYSFGIAASGCIDPCEFHCNKFRNYNTF